MAATRFRKFRSHEELELFVRGGISSGQLPQSAPAAHTMIYGLHGKTLVFTSPGTTVTFSDPTHEGLSLLAVAQQIETALTATYSVHLLSRQLYIVMATPTAAVVLGNTGTANTILGFNEGGATGKFYAPPDGVAPRWISVDTFGPSESVLLLATEE